VTEVARLRDDWQAPLAKLLRAHGLKLVRVAEEAPIPGSYWGGSEAGLIASRVYARADTPVHSVLHEASHALCMGNERRKHLHTDAGGDPDEENAVCYLQVVLAGELRGYGRARCCADMDRWGYSFRLGSALRWLAVDAEAPQAWLARAGLITRDAAA
jgi:hypothetical protein